MSNAQPEATTELPQPLVWSKGQLGGVKGLAQESRWGQMMMEEVIRASTFPPTFCCNHQGTQTGSLTFI